MKCKIVCANVHNTGAPLLTKIWNTDSTDPVEILRQGMSMCTNVHLELVEDIEGIDSWEEWVRERIVAENGIIWYFDSEDGGHAVVLVEGEVK